MEGLRNEISRDLEAWSRGDAKALDRLMPQVFDEVREIARKCLQSESPGHMLQPADLVNEIYLRLYERHTVKWQNRQQFLATLAQMMRRILVDHARRRLSFRRGLGRAWVPLEEAELTGEARPTEMVALDDALRALARLDPRKRRVVELRFFTGLTHKEIARELGVSTNTVDRDWLAAKLWLRRELSRGAPGRRETTDQPSRRMT